MTESIQYLQAAQIVRLLAAVPPILSRGHLRICGICGASAPEAPVLNIPHHSTCAYAKACEWVKSYGA